MDDNSKPLRFVARMEPPSSFYDDVDPENFVTRRQQFQQEAWEHFAGADPDKLPARIDVMAGKLEDLAERYDHRDNHVAFYKALVRMACDAAPDELDERISPASIERDSPWRCRRRNGETDFLLEPDEPTLTRAGIDVNAIDTPRHLHCFSDPTTWGEAISKLAQKLKQFSQQRRRAKSTIDHLQFRRAVLQNVLHQHEVFGSVQEKLFEASSVHHKRTLMIGRALIQYRREHDGALPDTDSTGRPFNASKEQFKEWGADVICKGKSTTYNALKGTGCYRADRMDNKQEVEQVVDAVVDYAQQHDDRLNEGR
jgi:hypothetical protein